MNTRTALPSEFFCPSRRYYRRYLFSTPLAIARALWYYIRMKKRLVTAIILTVLTAALLSGCMLAKPSTPSLSYDAVTGVVSWDRIWFCDGYGVKVVDNDTGETVADVRISSSQYAITGYGTFVVTVTAISDKRGSSDPASITVVRVNTQTDAVIDWQATNVDALEDMPVIPYFLNYYYPGCGAVSVPVNSEYEPVQLAGNSLGLLNASDWVFSNGCVMVRESVFETLDPGQHEMITVALDSGEKVQFRVDVRDSAAVTVAGIVCNTGEDGQDVKIAVEPAPVSVLFEGTEIRFSYDESAKELTVASAELSGMVAQGVGLLEMVFEDGSVLSEFVLVADTDTVASAIGSGVCFRYDKTAGGDLVIGLGNSEPSGNAAQDGYYYALAVDGKLVEVGSAQDDVAKFGADRDTLTIKASYLSELDRGAHRLEIYTRDGVATAYVYVYSRSLMCYDLEFDFDESYPDVVLKYSCDSAPDKLIVEIDGVQYSDEDYPDMFGDGRIILTGKIQKNDPVLIRSCFGNEVAVSETVTFAVDVNALDEYLDPARGYVWLGESVNRYIDSREELENLAHYMLLYYDELDTQVFPLTSGDTVMHTVTAYFDFESLGFSQSQLMTMLNGNSTTEGAFMTYKEAYSLACAVMPGDTVEENVIGIILRSVTEPTVSPSDRPAYVDYTENASNDFHLAVSDRGESYDEFPIDGVARTAVVSTSDQLFFAVEQGYRPLPEAGSAAERIYEKAREVCRTYIDDDMTDAEKVHVIYDWLGKNVVYDYSASSEMNGVDPNGSQYLRFYAYDCFFLEGVFDDGVAVCNGIAKAVTLLCGIEGITSLKVGGVSRGVKHAWNKVFIDGVWYIVDATWSNVRSTGNTELFTHDYLLISTPQSSPGSEHIEDTADTLPYYAPDGGYNYFSNSYFEIGGYKGNYYIGDAEELHMLVDFVSLKTDAEVTVDVFCSSLSAMTAFERELSSDRIVTITPCCVHFADEDDDLLCDYCRSGAGFSLTIGAAG